MIQQAIILLGGLGTRLRELYPDRPKALVPVAGKPFLAHQLNWLFRAGFTKIHLAAGYRAGDIEKWLETADLSPSGSVTLSHERAPLGTGGALKFIEPTLQSNVFVIVNGDTLAPSVDFQSLEKSSSDFPNSGKMGPRPYPHDETPPVYMVVTPIKECGRYGCVAFDDDGYITAFHEKTQRAAGWVNAGIYVLRKTHLQSIPSVTPCSLEHDVFPQLAGHRRLRVFKAPPPLLDMGTPDGLREMEEWLRAHRFPV